MRGRTPLSALLVLLAPMTAPSAAAAQTRVDLSSLLQKIGQSQEVQAKALARCGYTSTTRIEEVDSKGKPRSVTELLEKVSWENGHQQRRLVRLLEDGREVTPEGRERAQRESARGVQQDQSKAATSQSPQDPYSLSVEGLIGLANQPKYRFSIAGPDARQPSLLRIRFEPRGPATADTSIGEVVVDPSAGTVSLIRYRPAVLPAHTDRMDVEMEYGAMTPEGLALSLVSTEVEAGILFIRKRFRVRTTFSDYDCGGAP